MNSYVNTISILLFFEVIDGVKLPGTCEPGQYYEPSLLDCLPCRKNESLVTSEDGFGCACEDHSIRIGSKCKPCNVTEVVSTDGTMCVSRRCQSAAGRTSCRKCPTDYISVTQKFDGSPMKEVQCIKCARGYKAHKNACIKCEACICNKNQVIVKGKCIPKNYIMARPKYSLNELHPDKLLEIVELEYLCAQNDARACRSLAGECVRNFYTADPAGPCRLWLQSNSTNFQGFPLLFIDESKTIKHDLILDLHHGSLEIALAVHTRGGGFEFIKEPGKRQNKCLPPINIKIGENFANHCSLDTSRDKTGSGNILELYLFSPYNKSFVPLSMILLKPNGKYVQKESWPSNKFRKFFIMNSFISTTTNVTSIIYLQTLLFRVRVERDTSKIGSLRLQLQVEARYATNTHLNDIITTYIKVEQEMPNAAVLRSMEIWGSVLGSLMLLYGLIQWHGTVKRGGLYIAIIPICLNSIADGVYYATVISTLHALAADAGTLLLTLPLSNKEEYVIETVVYAIVVLKLSKILWVTWNQCRCDMFLLDWSKYNPPTTGVFIEAKPNSWKLRMLIREWMSMQTKRMVAPGFTATSTLLILQILEISQVSIPDSRGYKWVIATVTWWSSYATFLCIQFTLDKIFQSHSKRFLKTCTDLEISMLVFQEEYYAHYVDGRNEDLMGFRSNTNPLQTCRLVCSPQLRTVYSKLANSGEVGLDRNYDLLTKFLGAFFERALDGLNWVACERTLLEKALDVELISREGGKTSVLLYDTTLTTPSYFTVTWLGEEWLLATFDATLFGCILIATNQTVIAASVTLFLWQAMKFLRMLLGNLNVYNKTGLRI